MHTSFICHNAYKCLTLACKNLTICYIHMHLSIYIYHAGQYKISTWQLSQNEDVVGLIDKFLHFLCTGKKYRFFRNLSVLFCEVLRPVHFNRRAFSTLFSYPKTPYKAHYLVQSAFFPNFANKNVAYFTQKMPVFYAYIYIAQKTKPHTFTFTQLHEKVSPIWPS